MKLIEFTSTSGGPIAIPEEKITGFSGTKGYGKTFIATGADSPDGGENGWYVQDEYSTVKAKLEDEL